jgi:hypothetical protein
LVGPIGCGKKGCSGFVVRCGGLLGLMGFSSGDGVVFLGLKRMPGSEFDGEIVVNCWWDVVFCVVSDGSHGKAPDRG